MQIKKFTAGEVLIASPEATATSSTDLTAAVNDDGELEMTYREPTVFGMKTLALRFNRYETQKIRVVLNHTGGH